MKNIVVDFTIKNEDNLQTFKNIPAIKKEKSIIFKNGVDNFKIDISNNIIFEKENDESLIVFNFILNEKTKVKYYIKSLDMYIHAEVITTFLDIEKDKVKINYELCTLDKSIEKFEYELNMKEV